MSTLFPLTLNTWVPIATNDAHVLQSGGIGKAVYQVSATEPAPYADDQPVYNVTTNKTSFEYRNSQEGLTLWAWLAEGNAQVSVTPLLNSGLPDGLFTGNRAANVTFYTESNKKLGAEWEASRAVPLANVGTKVYSLIVVGSKTVDLKARTLGATGAGLYGRHYKIQPSDVTVDPQNADPWYNFRTSFFGTQPETKLYAQPNIVFNTVSGTAAELAVPANKVFADINAITNVQNQAAGVVPQAFGSNHILEPGDYILLEIESFDAAQTGTAGLEIYEGELDLPLP